MIELLAPAGNMESLRAAVQNGANAVYLGCGAFNARQSARNFTPMELAEAVKYCHVRGVKVHLTLNTLVSDRELPEVRDLIRHAAACGVDALIVQDLGVLSLCREIAPDMPVHGSTQMTVCSLYGVQMCAAWGMSRVVLSRELSREEIRFICQNSPIEIEVFAHGALCMCYSGQCYLSAMIGGRSGNRGRCAQPCRQSYGYGRWQDRYPLSLKDNCLVNRLKDLEDMGVASLKLEGRMKRPEYVAAVTGVYRKALDTGVVTREMGELLLRSFNRQGFTDGYFSGQTGQEMFGIREEKREDEKWAAEMRRTYEGTEAPLVPVRFLLTADSRGSQLTVSDNDGHTVTQQGALPEQARVLELDADTVAARLRKTGGTPYYCADVQVQIAPGLTLSAAAINAMRREALNLLTLHRSRPEHRSAMPMKKIKTFPGNRKLPVLTVQVTTREQITPALLNVHPEVLYVPLHLLAEDIPFCETLCSMQRVCAVLPRIVKDPDIPRLRQRLQAVQQAGVGEALVGNIGQMIPVRQANMDLRGDFGLNLYNSPAVNKMRELELLSVCLSMEMTLPQIRDVSKAVPAEILIYGRQSLMVTENCLIHGRTGQCTCQTAPAKLTDKTGAEFPVIRDGDSCRSILLNGKKLNWLDRQEDLFRLGIWATRLVFTTENPREVDRVLNSRDRKVPFDPGACTRGLYLRGLE